MNKSQGFTLIELIIVIVVLGILAVTAAPQFIDFSSDARTSATKGLKGALQGAAQTVYGRAAIDGQLGASTTAGESNSGIALVNGYPAASDDGIIEAADLSVTDIVDVADGSTASSDWVYSDDVSGTVYFAPAGHVPGVSDADETTITDAECYVQYVDATGVNSPPAITVVTTGC